jgi:hypothetical protein
MRHERWQAVALLCLVVPAPPPPPPPLPLWPVVPSGTTVLGAVVVGERTGSCDEALLRAGETTWPARLRRRSAVCGYSCKASGPPNRVFHRWRT